MNIVRTDARLHHCGKMARLLRYEQQLAFARAGVDPHRAIRAMYDQAGIRQAWLLDGQLAGMVFVSGPLLESVGFVSAALSQKATRHGALIVREARKFLEEISIYKSQLVTTVSAGDEAAMRFATFLGFHHGGPFGMPAVSRAGRIRLRRYLNEDPDLRIPTGQSYAIGLGYSGASA